MGSPGGLLTPPAAAAGGFYSSGTGGFLRSEPVSASPGGSLLDALRGEMDEIRINRRVSEGGNAAGDAQPSLSSWSPTATMPLDPSLSSGARLPAIATDSSPAHPSGEPAGPTGQLGQPVEPLHTSAAPDSTWQPAWPAGPPYASAWPMRSPAAGAVSIPGGGSAMHQHPLFHTQLGGFSSPPPSLLSAGQLTLQREASPAVDPLPTTDSHAEGQPAELQSTLHASLHSALPPLNSTAAAEAAHGTNREPGTPALDGAGVTDAATASISSDRAAAAAESSPGLSVDTAGAGPSPSAQHSPHQSSSYSPGRAPPVSALSTKLKDGSPAGPSLSLPSSALSTPSAPVSAPAGHPDVTFRVSSSAETAGSYVDVGAELAMAGGLERQVSHRTTADKFEAGEGEDLELKQMLWVVENLQEEMMAAQEHRLQAEAQQQVHRQAIASLQDQIAELCAQVSAADDELDMLQQRLENALHLKAAHEEETHQACLSLKAVQAQIAKTDELLAERDAQMDALKRRLQEAQEAASPAPAAKPAADPDGSPSPRSEASSTWGTSSNVSDDEGSGPQSPRRTPSSITESNTAKMAAAGATGGSWFRSMLGSRSTKVEGPPAEDAAGPVSPVSPGASATDASTSSYAAHVLDTP